MDLYTPFNLFWVKYQVAQISQARVQVEPQVTGVKVQAELQVFILTAQVRCCFNTLLLKHFLLHSVAEKKCHTNQM